MTDVQLTGTLSGLTQVNFADIGRYKRAIIEGEQLGLAYYFPYLMTYNAPGRSAALLGEDSGSVCIFLWKARTKSGGPRLDLLLAPSPMSKDVLLRCLERANDYNGDRSARVLMVDAHDADIFDGHANLRAKARNPQYLYSPEAFADIGGRKYRTMRRNISKVQALDNVEVLPYTEAHAESCLQLLRRWRAHHRDKYGTTGGVGTTKRLLKLAGQFAEPDIRGEVIKINEQLVGFAFGGEIRPGIGAFMEAKCDPGIQGLSYFQRYSFLSKSDQYKLVNDGSDVGRKGLQQLKNSLRPTSMHSVYRGVQKNRPRARPPQYDSLSTGNAAI